MIFTNWNALNSLILFKRHCTNFTETWCILESFLKLRGMRQWIFQSLLLFPAQFNLWFTCIISFLWAIKKFFLEVEGLPDSPALSVQVLLLWNFCIIHGSLFYSKPCYHKHHTAFCGFPVWHSFTLVVYSITDILQCCNATEVSQVVWNRLLLVGYSQKYHSSLIHMHMTGGMPDGFSGTFWTIFILWCFDPVTLQRPCDVTYFNTCKTLLDECGVI